ncbi:MAG: hypothetical protein HeimC3_20350 [Candidatus Heimdallarchaeota archaeon LC_3]|nr:MAG: hypothetical protein HeimC3_20350 [Candidatus Heimdallarchaeota archaeon LC_3]
MKQNLNKKEVQILLKEKELRNALLDSLIYFQKKSSKVDQYLEDIIEKVKNEKIKSNSPQSEEIDPILTSLTEELLSTYPEIKENYEFKKAQQGKKKTESISKSYGRTVLDNMLFTKAELEKRVGLKSSYVRNDFNDEPKQSSKSLTKSQNIVDDHEKFLRELESLTKKNAKKAVKINIESYNRLLEILRVFNKNLHKKELEKLINSIVNKKFYLQDEKINNSLMKALELIN